MRRLLVFAMLALAAAACGAQDLSSLVAGQTEASRALSLSVQVLAFMTALTLLPALLLSMTSFTRIIIVLAILRQALGTPQTPPNQVLVGLAVFLTFFIMAPVMTTAYETAVQPYLAGQQEPLEAARLALEPVREFMLAQTRDSDLVLFTELAGRDDVASPDELPISVLLPTFITSELKTAFQIGFLVFIPFLVIDLVVASVLMSMGMMMLSPMLISLPFKIMLFVMVDGWTLLLGTLASSFLG